MTAASAKAAAHPLEPGPNDGRIAYVTAQLLYQHHYTHHKLDTEWSEKFFDRYLETLDPQRLHFTQADIAEFEPYRDKLDDLTVRNGRQADTKPAFEIFNRFVQRLEQRVTYSNELLKNEKFEFNAGERMQLNRKDADYPKDLNEAKQLWRQRLRYEYLQEKLAKVGAKKTTTASSTAGKPAAKATETTTAKPAEPSKEIKKKSDAEDIADILTRRYTRNLKFFKDWDNEDVLQVYLNSLAHVYDPHSDYMNKIQADNFAIGMNLALIGIGAELFSDDGYCTIRKLVPGGPADKSKKIHEKDRIVAVAQGDATPVDVVDMPLNKVVQMIRGPRATEVRLTIQPANADASERYVLSLMREEIKLEDQEVKAKVIEMPNGADKPLRLGVIDLPSFYATIEVAGRPTDLAGQGGGTRTTARSTSADVVRLLKKFEKEDIAGVVLDLRRNGGGSLEEAVKLTGLFIKEGPVVQVRDWDGRVSVHGDEDSNVVYDGPLIVLTSRFSASASEILAGALQDYGRALIVGDQSTHGKGTVQRLMGLAQWVTSATNDPGEVKITMSKFYRASGASTQLKGVLPDIVLPSVFNYSKDIGEAALESPLEWDTIEPAKFQKLNLVSPYLGDLLKRSNARVTTNQDFAYIREDIEQFRKNQADKSVSLNESERLREKDEADARQKARDKERLARKESGEKVHELTLKQVDLLGLPPATNAVAKNVTGKAVTSAVSTNDSAAVSAAQVSDPTAKPDEEDDEEKPPAVDAALEETEHILVDYISLLPHKPMLSVNH